MEGYGQIEVEKMRQKWWINDSESVKDIHLWAVSSVGRARRSQDDEPLDT